jgi:peptide-methionine (S)-S-oxide reductase
MSKPELATLGGGCYWCLEAFYQRIEGIDEVTSGYSGGNVDNPTAERVYRGGTGHAEVVQLKFDPQVISYHDILEIFFVMHDPTTLNRQGNDVGEIYRSIIFYHDNDQKATAEEMKTTFAADLWPDEIVTKIEPFTSFWLADEYMQDYYNRNPSAGYCLAIIDPKIVKLRQKFTKRLKPNLA